MIRENNVHSDDRPARERDTFTAAFDPGSDRAPSTTVIESVATVTGSEPTALAPLFEAVDPDALDRLFDAGRDGADRSEPLSVSFQYEACAVTVHADGRVVVSEPIRDQR